MKLKFDKVKKIKEEAITVEATEVIDTKKNVETCSKCANTAGYRTIHDGSGDCYRHDEEYRTMGLYKGNGSYTDSLKEMESARGNIDSIDVQLRVLHATLQVLIKKADSYKTESEIPGHVTDAIARTSKQITSIALAREKIELQRITKQDIKEEFVNEIIQTMETVMRLHISDQEILNKISIDFNSIILSIRNQGVQNSQKSITSGRNHE